jgi:ribosomal protein S18 acetylase RimI-like enzyme
MRLALSTPAPDRLPALVADLASWQQDGLPVQLHPGDLAWQWRFGSTTLAEGLRAWTVDGTTVAIGLVDAASLIRMAVAPSADHDEELALLLVADLEDPARGVLDASPLTVEARFGTALRSRLRARGWEDRDPWTPLVRDLGHPVEETDLRVEVVGPEHVDDRVAVQRAAFDGSTFSAGLWHQMSQTPAYSSARCLVGYDAEDNAVAAVTVWSAGPGRPGLLEPMGVHRDHRGHGHGTAICLAAAAALRDLGASSATVATPSSNEGGVATYRAAGYRPMPEVTDFVLTR